MSELEVQRVASPVYVIGGFLGSGKTTLLKRLLKREIERGVKPGVLMNEFGEADVDGASLAAGGGADDIELRSILNGCMCCDLSSSVAEDLKHLIGKVNGAPVFIETTGLAATGQVVGAVRQALERPHDSQPHGRVAASVVVIDTPRFADVRGVWPAARTQLRGVDTLLLNKMDLDHDSHVRQVEAKIRRINPQARVLRASFADVDLEAITERPGRRRDAGLKIAKLTDTTRGFQSLTVSILQPIDLSKLQSLLKRFHRSVLRAKGFVQVAGARGVQEVQWVPGQFVARPYAGARALRRAHLVVIGKRVRWQRFFEQLDRCIPSAQR